MEFSVIFLSMPYLIVHRVQENLDFAPQHLIFLRHFIIRKKDIIVHAMHSVIVSRLFYIIVFKLFAILYVVK
jgi:hypothetical protein